MKDDPKSLHVATITVDEGTLCIGRKQLFYRRLAPTWYEPGVRPHLVFLHEGLGCTAMWHDFPVQVAAATGLPAISYDRSGYGRSPMVPGSRGKDYLHVEAHDVLPRLLDALKIDHAVLIGHSDGGSIALLAAAESPERFVGIITKAAHVFVESITLDGIRETVAAYEPRDLERRLARYHGAKARPLFFAWADTWLSEWFNDWNIEGCLGSIKCPALIIQGRDDPYGSANQVEAIASGIGLQAVSMMIPNCGHSPHRDAPQRVREAITAFMAPIARSHES